MSQPSTTNTTGLRTPPAAPKKSKAVGSTSYNRLQVTCRRRLEVTTSSSANVKARVSKNELSGGAAQRD